MRQFAIAIGNGDASFEQGRFRLALSQRSGDAVPRPDAELGVVFEVRVGGGDYRDAVLRGVTIQLRDGGHNALRMRHVEGSRGIEKIELRIDIDEDRFHGFRFVARALD